MVRLNRTVGQVQVSYSGADWFNASAPLDLQQGDTIATAAGAAEVEFENGAIAYLAENSTLELSTLDFGQGRITALTLVGGAATVYVNPAGADEFTVAAPGLEVAVLASAEFRVDADSNQASVQVLRGSVSVRAGQSTVLLEKGYSATVRQTFPGRFDIARLPQPDAFDRWVGSRSEGSTSGRETDGYPETSGAAGVLLLLPYGQVSSVYGPVHGRCPAPYGRGSRSMGGTGGIVFDCATRTFINDGPAVSPVPPGSRPLGSPAVLNDSEIIRVLPRPGAQPPNQIPPREQASPLRPRRNAFAPVIREAPARPDQRSGQAPRQAQTQPQTRQMGSWRAVSPPQDSGAALNPRPDLRMDAPGQPASRSQAGAPAGPRASSTRGTWGAGR